MSKENDKTGWMAFAADAPMIGLDPHPGYAPNEEIVATDAESWAECYGFCASLEEAQSEVKDDYEAMRQAMDEGDLEDAGEPDIIFPVSVNDEGRLVVYHADESGVEEIARYTAEQVFEAFGMQVPRAPTDLPEP